MKKNLMMRAGAIGAGLMVAFFAIVPDLVSAEGDSTEPKAEVEVAAETAKADGADTDAAEPWGSVEDVSDIELPPVSEELPAEVPENPEVPVNPELPEVPDLTEPEAPEPESPSDSSEAELPDKKEPDSEVSDKEQQETPEETLPEESVPGTELPSTEDAAQPTDSVQQDTVPSEAGNGNSAEMDSMEDYLEILSASQLPDDKKDDVLRRFEDEANMALYEEMYDDMEEDFIIEGTVLVGYTGAGGVVKIPDSVTAIGDSAFAGNASVTGVIFPANLQSIGGSAFAGCIGLQSIEVPEGVTSIAAGAFSGCSNLGSVSLPSTLASLDLSAFTGDVNLASISVASGSYSSYDGCIYTADGSQLLLCPQGKTGISFASGMRSVASGAFSGCGYLLSAVIPNVTGSIEANAFSGSAIKAVTIPANVTAIGSQAGWTPGVVYGYRGSAAETWANQSNYVFEYLDGPGTSELPVVEEHIEDDDSTSEDPGEDPNPGTNTPKINLGSAAAGTVTTAEISRNGGSRVNASTPKTGVEDYSIFFLCGAFLLAGTAFFAYSRKLRLDGNK